MCRKVIIARHVSGFGDMKLLASDVNATKNDMAKVSGFSPSQWVLGRQPRRGNGDQFDSEGFADIGSTQERYDGTSEFAKLCRYREAVREAFVKLDCAKGFRKQC